MQLLTRSLGFCVDSVNQIKLDGHQLSDISFAYLSIFPEKGGEKEGCKKCGGIYVQGLNSAGR
jgi:hypothetical protein